MLYLQIIIFFSKKLDQIDSFKFFLRCLLHKKIFLKPITIDLRFVDLAYDMHPEPHVPLSTTGSELIDFEVENVESPQLFAAKLNDSQCVDANSNCD